MIVPMVSIGEMSMGMCLLLVRMPMSVSPSNEMGHPSGWGRRSRRGRRDSTDQGARGENNCAAGLQRESS